MQDRYSLDISILINKSAKVTYHRQKSSCIKFYSKLMDMSTYAQLILFIYIISMQGSSSMKYKLGFRQSYSKGPTSSRRLFIKRHPLWSLYPYTVEKDIHHMFVFCNFVMLATDLCHTERWFIMAKFDLKSHLFDSETLLFFYINEKQLTRWYYHAFCLVDCLYSRLHLGNSKPTTCKEGPREKLHSRVYKKNSITQHSLQV